MLNFTNFELEDSVSCKYDFLEIRNGAAISSPLIGKYCGTNAPNRVVSHTNQLLLHFKSDGTKSRSGFKVFWNAAATGKLTS